jgi:hypothetical protein
MAARQVSMLSPIISKSPGGPSRTAPPRHGPSIIFAGSTGAFALPSTARKVRWMPVGLPFLPHVTSATIAGQTPPEECFSPAWKRTEGGTGIASPRERK